MHLAVKIAYGHEGGQAGKAGRIVREPSFQEKRTGKIQDVDCRQQQEQSLLHPPEGGRAPFRLHPPQHREQHQPHLGQKSQSGIHQAEGKGELPKGLHPPPQVCHLPACAQHQHRAEIGQHQAPACPDAAPPFGPAHGQTAFRPDKGRSHPPNQIKGRAALGRQVASQQLPQPGAAQSQQRPQRGQAEAAVQQQGFGPDLRLPAGLEQIAQKIVTGVQQIVDQRRSGHPFAPGIAQQGQSAPACRGGRAALGQQPCRQLAFQCRQIQPGPVAAAIAQIDPVVQAQSQTGQVGRMEQEQLPIAERFRPQGFGQHQAAHPARRQGRSLPQQDKAYVPPQPAVHGRPLLLPISSRYSAAVIPSRMANPKDTRLA